MPVYAVDKSNKSVNQTQQNNKMATKIQWICRGLRANYDEVELLINKYDSVALCVQELQVSDSYDLNNNMYTLI